MKRKIIILRIMSISLLLSSLFLGGILFLARGKADYMMILFVFVAVLGIAFGIFVWKLSLRLGFFCHKKKYGDAWYSFRKKKYYGKIDDMMFCTDSEDELILQMYEAVTLPRKEV